MKICTITCHDVYNAGASLQAYALVQYLRSLGHDAVIIDYKPDYLSNHFNLTEISNPRYDRPLLREAYIAAKLPGRLRAKFGKRKKAFDSFRKQYLPLTKRYNSLDELINDPPVADIYIAGSDQIWNTLFPNGRDPAFYLDFAPNNAVKASYAASFSTENIEEEYRDEVSSRLRKLDCISVRERSGVELASRLGVPGVVQVMDPVFLFSANEWEKLAIGGTKKGYVFVYDFDGNDMIRNEAERLANENDLRIVSWQNLDYADQYARNAGPAEFISLVKDAEYVLSNSFHATAFSLIFKKQFAVFDRSENINTRMHDLMASIGIGSREIADAPSDQESIQKTITENINLSKAYIESILKK